MVKLFSTFYLNFTLFSSRYYFMKEIKNHISAKKYLIKIIIHRFYTIKKSKFGTFHTNLLFFYVGDEFAYFYPMENKMMQHKDYISRHVSLSEWEHSIGAFSVAFETIFVISCMTTRRLKKYWIFENIMCFFNPPKHDHTRMKSGLWRSVDET